MTGEDLQKKYSSWTPERKPDTITEDAVIRFKDAILRAYSNNNNQVFEKISFIRAFLRSCHGFDDDLPIHYPRATERGYPGPPNPKGESFKWFVANETRSAQYALDDLENDKGLPDKGLPTLQDHSSRFQGNRRRNG